MNRATDEEMKLVIDRDRLKGAGVFGVPSLGQCYYGDCYAAWNCSGGCLRDRYAKKLACVLPARPYVA